LPKFVKESSGEKYLHLESEALLDRCTRTGVKMWREGSSKLEKEFDLCEIISIEKWVLCVG